MAEESAVAPAQEIPVRFMYRWGRGVCRTWSDLWFDLKVYGTKNVPPRGGVLIVSNHQSYLDPILVGVKLVRPVSFLAKSELFENKYFGWLIRNLNAFPVRLGDGDIGAVRETIRRLQEGHALNLYPEGSRTPDGTIQPMQAGMGLIIRRAGVPVVPAVVSGSFDAWPRNAKIFRPHPVRVQFGPAMDLKDLKATEIVRRVDVTLRTMFDELRTRPLDK